MRLCRAAKCEVAGRSVFPETAGMKLRHTFSGWAFFLGTVIALAADPDEARKKLVMLIAEPEYDTSKTLPEFAAKFLEHDFRVVIVRGSTAAGENTFDHPEEIADADVLLVSVRRRTPPVAQFAFIRKFVEAGKPVVGIRTACHAFALAGKDKLAPGNADWPEWDAQVIGGHYTGHHGHGPITHITTNAANDAILRGVMVPFDSDSWFYKVSPLEKGAKPGEIPGQPTEPVAWTFMRADGGRTFFTSLGNPADFQNTSFRQLLRNGILWAAGR